MGGQILDESKESTKQKIVVAGGNNDLNLHIALLLLVCCNGSFLLPLMPCIPGFCMLNVNKNVCYKGREDNAPIIRR